MTITEHERVIPLHKLSMWYSKLEFMGALVDAVDMPPLSNAHLITGILELQADIQKAKEASP